LKPCIVSYFLTVSLCFAVATGHTQSSAIPACLEEKAKDSTWLIQHYYYKGQLWYGFSRKNTAKVSDYLATIRLANGDCDTVGQWKKGGIAGLNRLTPDTIDVKKLWLRQFHSFLLPDTIRSIAKQQHAFSVDAYIYKGEALYLMAVKKILTPAEKSKKIIREYYYRIDGTVALVFKRAIEGSFMRAQGWETAGVDPLQLKKLSYYWQQHAGDYIYQQP
jgi:hypothetical protein